jgi:formylmethanofuran dehydrogenase subunit E
MGREINLKIDGLSGDCPFAYGDGEIEPPEPKHKVKGECVSCGENAYTQNPKNLDEFVCWGCAYSLAN